MRTHGFVFHEESGDGVFLGIGVAVFDTHKEECFGNEIGALGRFRESGDGEDVEGKRVRMLRVDKMVVALAGGRCPLSTGDAGCREGCV